MPFEIITDSSCNLTEELISENRLHILPMRFMSDGREYQSYLKGEKTDLGSFYTMMREGKQFTTSLPCLEYAADIAREIFARGNDVLYLAFSSGLSGTYEAIERLYQAIALEYPGRRAVCVDTLAASGGQGLLVLLAARKAREGLTLDELVAWTNEKKYRISHWFTVDDLAYLKRGGRISLTSAWAGTLLNIKPVLHVDDDGHLVAVHKLRGRRKSLLTLVDEMENKGVFPQEGPVLINHGDCLEDARFVAEEIERRFGPHDIIINYVDPVIGAHSGPGTVALFFVANGR